MHARHYAPRARVIVAEGEAARAESLAASARGERVGFLARGRSPGALPVNCVELLSDDAAGYAAGLYAALHRLDDAGCDCIVVEAVPDDPAWAAVRDRLRRASAPPT
jgi:L-threonylcarbamoyladenylate synthase